MIRWDRIKRLLPKAFRSWKARLRYMILTFCCVFAVIVGIGQMLKDTPIAGEYLTVLGFWGFISPGDDVTDWVGHTAGTPIDWDAVIAAQSGQIETVVNTVDLQGEASLANPGDSILMQNGTYGTTTITDLNGTATDPIVIAALNPGGTWGSRGVQFIGRFKFVNCSHLIIGGFDADHTGSGSMYPGMVVFENCRDCRLTDTFVEATGQDDQYGVQFYRHSERITIDHCDVYVVGGFGIQQRVEWGDTLVHGRGGSEEETGVVTNNCTISYVTNRGINTTGSTDSTHCIQIGQYPEQRALSTYCTVEYCYLHGHNVSVGEFKTSNNIIRNTYIYNNTRGSSWWLRSGVSNQMRSCLLKDNNAGIWVQDKDGVVFNNIIDNCGGHGLRMSRGANPDTIVIGGVQSVRRNFCWVRNTLVANNTWVNHTGSNVIEIGHPQYPCGQFSHDQCGEVPPANIRVYNNSIQSSTSGTRAIYHQEDMDWFRANHADGGLTEYSEANAPDNDFKNNHLWLTGGAVDGKSAGVTWSQTGEQTGDPALSGYTPTPSSVLVGAGIEFNILGVNSLTETDYHGNPRSQSGIDIGAAEMFIDTPNGRRRTSAGIGRGFA